MYITDQGLEFLSSRQWWRRNPSRPPTRPSPLPRPRCPESRQRGQRRRRGLDPRRHLTRGRPPVAERPSKGGLPASAALRGEFPALLQRSRRKRGTPLFPALLSIQKLSAFVKKSRVQCATCVEVLPARISRMFCAARRDIASRARVVADEICGVMITESSFFNSY